jgi:hypothetical protein
MITSAIVFHEHVTSLAWLGGIILSAGIAIVGSEKEHPSQMETQELDKQNPESARVPAMASNKSGGSERD